ncbi:hypothetical protein A2V56_03275 [Candidatus Woesebacteria bacterium RBG_19FT_COMBO_42_9]|uniref:Uncharacterized protein n=1 Tax=Candidatus Woesebacteria bacterium RBG_16_42_24 TaxID=1802485 RepID=A0A1F7XKP1_9BACT|nr:MAG: hypothetical protein A2V97_01830 [Candidatus Woesebacteria bacterium RBG_16_42_24]OGM16397.1 MAG: hypothetical protein A2V56_03275 [Candidatus Woesebacteria bacterium RBG_19FT_COMBO_42_9]OGM67326.1 MAG: hypothetical protein A2985_04190 [Candidatus Woesebacteria bacterium RIFCSPLOWO2_01_FULL_43_11]
MADGVEKRPFFPYPEFYLGSQGKYVHNEWTRFADDKLMTQPNMEQGLTQATYQNWLDWQYELFAINDLDNPLERSPQELQLAHRIEPLWMMSFEQKRFFPGVEILSAPGDDSLPNRVSTWSATIIDPATLKFHRLERELIQDRFGNDAFVERFYECITRGDEGNLQQIVIVTSGGSNYASDRHFMRVEPIIQWSSAYTLKVDNLHRFLDLADPVDTEVKSKRDAYLLRTYP